MKRIYTQFIFLCGITSLAFLSGCVEDKEIGSPEYQGRQSMLIHYADNMIMPAYNNLNKETAALSEQLSQLNSQSTDADLKAVRNQWKKSLEIFQEAAMYDFGPAAAEGTTTELSKEIASFPANTTLIETFIQQKDTAFKNFDRNTRGFLAIEYLLYTENPANALSELTTNADRRVYLRSLGRHLAAQTERVATQWKSYRDDFVKDQSISSGSSTSEMYNAFVKGYETLKNFKLGLPLGKRPGQAAVAPEQVQAYYSGESLYMVQKQLDAVWRVYTGTPAGQTINPNDETGWDHYVANTTGGKELLNETTTQWQKVTAAFAELPKKPLQTLIVENTAEADAAYTEAQKQTRFFKSEMESLLGILITFSDNDGD